MHQNLPGRLGALQLATRSEIAKSLGISLRHLDNLRDRRLIPFVVLGSCVRFDPAAVRLAMERLTVGAAQ
jgi:hypothetical protein